jgi:hypothetical protein
VFLGLVNKKGMTSVIITEGSEIFLLHMANSSIPLTMYVTHMKVTLENFSYIPEEFKLKLLMATIQRAVP